jgi:hypothetical protein
VYLLSGINHSRKGRVGRLHSRPVHKGVGSDEGSNVVGCVGAVVLVGKSVIAGSGRFVVVIVGKPVLIGMAKESMMLTIRKVN